MLCISGHFDSGMQICRRCSSRFVVAEEEEKNSQGIRKEFAAKAARKSSKCVHYMPTSKERERERGCELLRRRALHCINALEQCSLSPSAVSRHRQGSGSTHLCVGPNNFVCCCLFFTYKVAPYLNYLFSAVVATSLCLVSLHPHPHPPLTSERAEETFSLSQENVLEAVFQGKYSIGPTTIAIEGVTMVNGICYICLSLFSSLAGDCESHNPCQHLCFDLHDGTFECACLNNYFLSDNGYSCVPHDSVEDGQNPFDQQQPIEQANHHPYHHIHQLHPHHFASTHPPSAQVSTSRVDDFVEENLLFSNIDEEDEDEDIDLDQFSSANSQMFFAQGEPPEQRTSKKSPVNSPFDLFRSYELDTQNTDPSHLLHKKVDLEMSHIDTHQPPQVQDRNNFNSCNEVECESGGICVTESLDTSSQLLLPSNINSVITPNLQSRLAMAMSETTFNKSTFRCRCPLGRKGFFCEKRKYFYFHQQIGQRRICCHFLSPNSTSIDPRVPFRQGPGARKS